MEISSSSRRRHRDTPPTHVSRVDLRDDVMIKLAAQYPAPARFEVMISFTHSSLGPSIVPVE